MNSKTWRNGKVFNKFKISGEKYTGEGIKRLKGYKCDLLIDQLEALREKFWSK